MITLLPVIGSFAEKIAMFGRQVPRKPCLVGGSRGTNRNEISLARIQLATACPGSPPVGGKLHMYPMFGFGLFEYIMRKTGFPISPMVLGVNLGNMAYQNPRRAMGVFKGDVIGPI